MNIVELFAGAGGFTYSAGQLGFTQLAVLEPSRTASHTLRINCAHYLNIARSNIFHIEPKAFSWEYMRASIDLVVATPPDADFTAIYQTLRYLAPKSFIIAANPSLDIPEYKADVIRQVNQLSASSKGRASDVHMGYAVSFKTINAADYAIAHKQHKLVIVGIRNDVNQKWKWPEPSHSESLLHQQQNVGTYWQKHGVYPSLIEKPSWYETWLADPITPTDSQRPWQTVRDLLFLGKPPKVAKRINRGLVEQYFPGALQTSEARYHNEPCGQSFPIWSARQAGELRTHLFEESQMSHWPNQSLSCNTSAGTGVVLSTRSRARVRRNNRSPFGRSSFAGSARETPTIWSSTLVANPPSLCALDEEPLRRNSLDMPIGDLQSPLEPSALHEMIKRLNGLTPQEASSFESFESMNSGSLQSRSAVPSDSMQAINLVDPGSEEVMQPSDSRVHMEVVDEMVSTLEDRLNGGSLLAHQSTPALDIPVYMEVIREMVSTLQERLPGSSAAGQSAQSSDYVTSIHRVDQSLQQPQPWDNPQWKQTYPTTGEPVTRELLLDDGSVATLTPEQIAKIQTFPSHYFVAGTPSQAIRQLTQSVPVDLATILLTAVERTLHEDKEKQSANLPRKTASKEAIGQK